MNAQRTFRLYGQQNPDSANKIMMTQQPNNKAPQLTSRQQLANNTNSTSNFYQKRHRTSFNQYQLQLLEDSFKLNSYPSAQVRDSLAAKTQLDASRIQVWFQNRRAKRKKQLNQMNQVIRLASSSHHQQQQHHHHHRHQLPSQSQSQLNRAAITMPSSLDLGPLALAGSTINHQSAAMQQQMALDLHMANGTGSHQYSPILCQAGSSATAASLMIQSQIQGSSVAAARQLCGATDQATTLGLDLAAGADDSASAMEPHGWLSSCQGQTDAKSSGPPQVNRQEQHHQNQNQSQTQGHGEQQFLFGNVMIRSSSLPEVRDHPHHQQQQDLNNTETQPLNRSCNFRLPQEIELEGQQAGANWSTWS